MTGPLTGLRIVEFAGIGPAPFAGMMLTDAGADIIRIDRHDRASYPPQETAHLDLMNRGRRSVAVDLKNPDGVALALRLIDQADGLMEGFRPGVAERLGIGPEVCMKRNPRLVYGRMTGWGQTGPLAETAGHDIDYISIAGALESIGRAGQPPLPPLNLIGDFGGGGMLMAFGMVAAILSAQKTGEGQVVDAAMVDGAAALMTMIYTFRSMGIWQDVRGRTFSTPVHRFTRSTRPRTESSWVWARSSRSSMPSSSGCWNWRTRRCPIRTTSHSGPR